MDALLEFLRLAGTGAGYLLVVLLCVTGLLLSCLSLFGAWLVMVAAMVAAWLPQTDFPGLGTVLGFGVIAALLEVLEAIAGAWGVQGRGGSMLAGFAALVGGLAGLIFGSVLLPIPVLGSLLGMMTGGFLLAFGVEYGRLRHSGRAAHIAWGAVTARIAVIFLKVMATMGMIGWLAAGMVLASARGAGGG